VKVKEYLLIVLFLSFIGGIGLFNLFQKDIAFSELENRPLSQFPTFTKERFLSGEFNRAFETYLSDQFIAKEWWTGLKVKAEQAILKQENNGIYFGKDHFLFEKTDALTSQLEKNIAILNAFQERNPLVNQYVALAPTSIELYPKKLPPFASTGIQEEAMDLVTAQLNPIIQVVDVFKPLQQMKQEPIYYRTDHHWTSKGAFYAYREVAKAMGLIPFELEDFIIETVSDAFYGTFYSKASDNRIPPDKIDVFTPKRSMTYSVSFGNETQMNSLYDSSFLQKRDKYSFFLGGNHAQAVIHSSVKNGKKLLLVKDSYAHAIAPFLANHFEEIHMLDLRYYHASIEAYIEEQGINDALIMYNTKNFSADHSVVYLKY